MRTIFVRSLLAAALVAGAPFASAALVTSGVANITGTWSFDFDAGVQGNFILDPGQDAWWEQINPTTRQLVPVNGAQLLNLGNVSFAGLTEAALQSLSYGNAPILGSNVGNQLTFGDVFAVKTTAGNYAKVLVSSPFFDPGNNNGLIVYYETYTGVVPEPTTAALGLVALACLAAGPWRARQRRSVVA